MSSSYKNKRKIKRKNYKVTQIETVKNIECADKIINNAHINSNKCHLKLLQRKRKATYL